VRSVTAREAGEMMAGLAGSSGGSSSSGGGGASSGGDNNSTNDRSGITTTTSAGAPSGGPPAGERWTLLDVRPPHEQQKVPIEGAAPVPFFIADPDGASLAGLLRAAASFGMGGWWLGGAPLVPNPDFLDQAAAALPSDRQSARVVVACQKGLRSLAACEALIRAGFPHVAWVSGGLDSALPGDLPTPGGKDVRYAGIGGVSEALGWTEVQREARRLRRGGAASDLSGVFALAGAVLAMDLLLFAYEHWASTHPGWPNPFQY
jgi:rhodanese-related sulfurtransferase